MPRTLSFVHERSALFIILSAYWVLPGHWEPLAFRTAAVGVHTIFVIAALGLICFVLPWKKAQLNFSPHLLSFAAALLIAISHVPKDNSGLTARYYDNANFSGQFEISIPKESTEYTRTEPAINFSARGFSFYEQYFLLAFANESQRRQWQPNSGATTENYPFSIEMNGYIEIPSDITSLKIIAEGGSAQMLLEGNPVATNTVTPIASGTYAINLRYSHNEPTNPVLRLLWQNSGDEKVVPAKAFAKKSTPNNNLTELMKIAALAIWLSAFAVTLFQAYPKAQWNKQSSAWLIFLALMIYLSIDLQRDGSEFNFQIFQPGDDWFAYESLARAIAQGDWLSESEGTLIFLNFGYRYILALMHWLSGEAPANALLLQRAVMAACIAFACFAVQQLYGHRTAIVLFIVILLCKPFLKFSQPLLDTTFGISLGFIALYCLIQYHRAPKFRWIIIAAAMLGISFLLRANFLPFLLVAIIWCYVYAPARGKRRKIDLIVLALCPLLIFSAIALRNHSVADQWVFMPTNGLPNLWIGNHPPEFDGPTYFTAQQPPHNEIIPRVIKYWQTDPIALAERTWNKALYIFEFNQRHHFQEEIGLPWLIAIIGSISLWRQYALRPELILLWSWICVVNGPLLLLFPWGYGWRLSAPSFLPLYLICSLSLVHWFGKLRGQKQLQSRTDS